MELRDVIVTPIVISLIYMGAIFVRPYVTDEFTRPFFLPALTVRIIGALALGFIYQFYYGGGDTFNYHTGGSRFVWEALIDSPEKGLQMMFSGGIHHGSFYKYSSRIEFFGNPSAFFVIRMAALFDIFTFSSYSATAVLFAVFGFVGAWMLYYTFYRKYPALYFWFAIAILFIPSVFFWGSGLLKDTIVLSAIGMATYEIDRLFVRRKISLIHIAWLLMALYFIFMVKKFVLQAYLPAAIIWIYLQQMKTISSVILRILIFPFVILISTFIGYYAVVKVGEGDQKYAVDKLAETARITAADIHDFTGRNAGSGYTLGELDGSFLGMLKLAPAAVNVALFRPYLWEVNNPLMLLSALESLVMLLLVLYLFFKKGLSLFSYFKNPDVAFCLVFSIMFAFAVGVSTFNFGTLVRYKIPALPFFSIALLVITFYSNSDKNTPALDDTE